MDKINPKKMMHVTLKILGFMHEQKASEDKTTKAVMNLITIMSEISLTAKNEGDFITTFAREAYTIINKTHKQRTNFDTMFTKIETKLNPKQEKELKETVETKQSPWKESA